MYVSMCSRMNIRVCLSVYSVFVYGCMRVCDLHLCMVLFAVCLCYACVVGMCLYFRAALCAWPVWFLGCGCRRGCGLSLGLFHCGVVGWALSLALVCSLVAIIFKSIFGTIFFQSA